MGLKDGKCDSCDIETDYLFPAAIKEKQPTGVWERLLKYFCLECYTSIQDHAEETDNENKQPPVPEGDDNEDEEEEQEF